MRRVSAVAALLIAGLSACSGTVTVPLPSLPPLTSSDPAAAAKVEAYCKKVDALVKKANELQANPNASLSAELGKQAQELAQQAVGLVGAVARDPALAARVSECSAKTADIAAG